MDIYLITKFLHILGATILIGTGSGIAFFMLIAHRSQNIATIAGVSKIVVLADYVFTLSAAVLQPLTGFALIGLSGYQWNEAWIVGSIALYIFIGVLWIPVIFMQKKMQILAQNALTNHSALDAQYYTLFRQWFWCGAFAFPAILAILALMIAKPQWP